ncbi:peptidoglycan-binding domain-containing protein [Sporolactobacillus laevolacticus]|uniref:peptidoglycan-binding domain-containing protein n=1 Tax=Sporolactobacillus laevolacticus TaxID=33018 RepID=UPI00338DA898
MLNITADGIYRVKTAAVVKAFQKNHGPAIDGIVGLCVSNNHFNWTYRQQKQLLP